MIKLEFDSVEEINLLLGVINQSSASHTLVVGLLNKITGQAEPQVQKPESAPAVSGTSTTEQ